MSSKYCGEEFVRVRRTQKFCCHNHQQAYWKGMAPMVDDRHAIPCDPGRSIKGKEFRELAKLYAGRDMRQSKEIGFLFQWNRAAGI